MANAASATHAPGNAEMEQVIADDDRRYPRQRQWPARIR